MKTLGLLIFGLLTIVTLNCRAVGLLVTNGGAFSIGYYDVLTSDDPTTNNGSEQLQVNITPQAAPTPPIIAEALTPEIQALADGLQDDPVRIFNYVHDHIRYVLYFGSKKGANLTLLEKSGNDFDQCALLVALLRAAGYTNAGDEFAWMSLPFDNPDLTHRDLHHWLGLNFTNTDWSATVLYLQTLFGSWRGYPLNSVGMGDFGDNAFALQRVLVTVTVAGTNYLLDPSFKVTEPIAGISLSAAMGSSASLISNALITAAGGTDFGAPAGLCYASNLNEAAIRGTLAGYATNLLHCIQSNYPNASVEQILGGQYIVPSTNTSLSQDSLFPTITISNSMPSITWINEPTNLMSRLQIIFGGKGYQWFMPQLQGQRISLVYGSSSVALWQDDTNLASRTFSTQDAVTLTAHHPFQGTWDTTNNVYIPGGGYTFSYSATYRANSHYAILYSFEPDWGWLQERERQLESYRQQGYPDTSRQVTDETLNVMGLNWELQTEYLSRMLAQQIGVLPMNYQKAGRMAQESGRGYYVDVYLNTESSANNVGQACFYPCDINHGTWCDLYSYFASAMEHGMIEQLQESNLIAASAVKMLELANTNQQAVFLATSNNWSSVRGKLSNYTLNDLAIYINAGYQLLLPQNGSVSVSGSSHPWKGFGFMARKPDHSLTQMVIGPGVYGGYVGDDDATIDSGFVDYSGYSAPVFFSAAPPSLPLVTAADPVDMVDGTFQVQTQDLSLGQKEPRGLSFSRYYNSSRRTSNLAGIAPGWIHNYYLNAATISLPQAALGGTTPAQAASMLTATAAAISVYNSNPDPKNWIVTALIAKLGVDQLTAKAVPVALGKDTLQFIEQPDGSYTPPANSTMTLANSNSSYSLQERHGRSFSFNSSGWATAITDPYNQSLTLGYNSSNWVTSVNDWTNRSLTFNYSTSNPKHLISVVDNTGRSIYFGYSASTNSISVTDAENKTSMFGYDTNHQMTAVSNALNQLVVSNIYNGFGRVTTQYTQGDTNKTWENLLVRLADRLTRPRPGQQAYFL